MAYANSAEFGAEATCRRFDLMLDIRVNQPLSACLPLLHAIEMRLGKRTGQQRTAVN